jgi:dCMP deaminase
MNKKENYIDWDTYFFMLAISASLRSKDPSTINGAVIVDPISKVPISIGYNGFPRGLDDDKFTWSSTGSPNKYDYVEHAERNAIYNAARQGVSTNNTHLYLYSEKGYYPCKECTNAIIQSGITKVFMLFYESQEGIWSEKISQQKFECAKIDVINKTVNFKILSDLKMTSNYLNDLYNKLS